MESKLKVTSYLFFFFFNCLIVGFLFFIFIPIHSIGGED